MPVSELARRLGVSRHNDTGQVAADWKPVVSLPVTACGSATRRALAAFWPMWSFPWSRAKASKWCGLWCEFPQVETLHTVSGKFDLIARIRALTTDHIDQVLDDIGLIEGVTRTESAIILSTKLDRPLSQPGRRRGGGPISAFDLADKSLAMVGQRSWYC